MRFFYHNDGNPRLDHLNSILSQPLLFAPADTVKALTFGAFYGAGPRPMARMLCGQKAPQVDVISVTRRDRESPDSSVVVTSDMDGDIGGDAVTRGTVEYQWPTQLPRDSKSPAFTGVRVRVSPWAPQNQ